MMLTKQRPRPARSLQTTRHCEASVNPPKSMTRLSQLPTTTTCTTLLITTLPATTTTTTTTTTTSCEDGDVDDDGDDDDTGDFNLSGLRHNFMMKTRMATALVVAGLVQPV